MTFDKRISEALLREAGSVMPDVPASLRTVKSRVSGRRRTRLLVTLAAVCLLVAASAFVGGVLVGQRSHRISPSRDLHHQPVGLRVVGGFDPASLGFKHVLAAALSPNGDLYLTDASERVAEVTPQGHLVRSWGRSGTGPGQFRFEKGAIAVDRRGRVYVSDSANFRIEIFTPTGRLIRSIGGFGRGPGEFLWTFDVAVDDSFGLYVADDRSPSLSKISPQGRQVWRVGGPDETEAAFIGHEHFQGFDRDGQLVATNDDIGEVLFINRDGQVVRSFGDAASGDHEGLNGTGQGLFPHGACDATVSPDGRIFVAPCVGDAIEVFGPDQHLLGTWSGSDLLRSPFFGPDGMAYGVTASGSIVEFTTDVSP